MLRLKWTDIDWDVGRLRIDSPKTGLRFCPLFPELRVVLSEAFDLAPDGAVHVVARYRDGQNLRTQFGRIIESAGLFPWPKPFNNLRASRRTELQEQFPSHVINQWLGQSTAVAERHYLQVTEEHWKAAVESRPHVRPHITNGSDPITKNQDIKKPLENIAIDASQGLVIGQIVTPMGSELSGKSLENSIELGLVPTLVPTKLSLEILRAVNQLPVEKQAAVLEFALSLEEKANDSVEPSF